MKINKKDLTKDEILKKKRIYHSHLMKLGICPWTSWKTTERKIKTDDFPAVFDGRRWVFEIEKIESWFKRRQHSKAA